MMFTDSVNEIIEHFYGNILIIKGNINNNNCTSINSNEYEKIYNNYFCNTMNSPTKIVN